MRALALALASLGLLLLLGCNQPESPDQIRQRTAEATSQVKQDTKAVAEGIKDGLKSHSDSSGRIDLNAADKRELMTLPGITEGRADRIIAARPYDDTHELVTKNVLTRGEYDQIEARVTAHK